MRKNGIHFENIFSTHRGVIMSDSSYRGKTKRASQDRLVTKRSRTRWSTLVIDTSRDDTGRLGADLETQPPQNIFAFLKEWQK